MKGYSTYTVKIQNTGLDEREVNNELIRRECLLSRIFKK